MDRICKRGRKPQSSACRSGFTFTIIQYFRMKRYILLALSVCQSLVVLAAEAPRKSTDANLFGHVVDRDTHEHIAYASVAVVGTAFGTTTDASGHYFLKNLPVGELTLEVRALGYASGRMTVALERGETRELNFEVAQSGIELIGDGSMAADIQVITLACRAMQSTVPGFKIELGHAGYFGAVLRNLNVKPAVKAEICHLIEQKNFAALGDLLDTLEDCRETRVLRRLPRLFGGPEVLDEARELYTEGGADASLQYIKTLYDTLCAAGLQEQVLLDLGIVNRSNYYTGVIFRGYVQGSGLTVLSGGRYDNLLGEFGTDKPAIGFAVDVSAVTDVLHEEINLDRPLRIALTKGRLEKASVQMFKTMGLNTEALENKGRRLILPVDQYEAVLSKAPDVITYVEHGVCDIGIVGKDTIVEHGSAFYEVLDLNIGRCAFALATKKGTNFFSGYKRKTVASKYPKVAKEFFKSKGMDVDVIKIEGSVELAPLLGLADGIVDIVETGSTLKENGLEVVEKIMPISARVIVNMASMKLRKDEIEAFLHDIELAAQVG